jgi:antitoxin component YwqK of YwqJK toxin-antitoxin module
MTQHTRTNYQNGKIYKIVNDTNNMLYIGCTTQELSRRFSVHRLRGRTLAASSKLYLAMHALGADHFRIVLIERFACNSKDELEAKEYAIMLTFEKALLYNSIFDSKHSVETRAALCVAQKKVMRSGRASAFFKRGHLRTTSTRYELRWRENGANHCKGFTFKAFSGISQIEAYMACIDFQNELYPLTYAEYAKELPFAIEE